MGLNREKSLMIKSFLNLDASASTVVSGYPASNIETNNRSEYCLLSQFNTISLKNTTGVGVYADFLFLSNFFCTNTREHSSAGIPLTIKYFDGTNFSTIKTISGSDWDFGKGQLFTQLNILGSPFLIPNNGAIIIENSIPNVPFRCGVARCGQVFESLNQTINFKIDRAAQLRNRPGIFETEGGTLYTRDKGTSLFNYSLNYDSQPLQDHRLFEKFLNQGEDLTECGLYIPNMQSDKAASHSAIWGKITNINKTESSKGGCRISGGVTISEV